MSIAWRRARAISAWRQFSNLFSATKNAPKPGSRRRSIACFWIMPIRRRCQKHDNSFQAISKPQLWLEPDNGGQTHPEKTPPVAVHLMPDSIRAQYWRAAIAWLVLFGVVPSIYPQYSLSPTAATSEQSGSTMTAASDREGANTEAEFRCSGPSFDRSTTCVRSGKMVNTPIFPATYRMEILRQTHEILRFKFSQLDEILIGSREVLFNALKPSVTIIVSFAGFIIILIGGPAFIYLRCRRPVCDQIDQLIPEYLIGYVRHTPHHISLGEEIQNTTERLAAFARHMTVDFLFRRDRHEPVNWRNIPSTQGQMIDLAILSFVARAFAIRHFQWPLYAGAFFFGPAIVTYGLLWGLSIFEIYKPLYFGGAALIWGIFAVVNVMAVMSRISRITNPSDGGVPMRIPTAVKDRHNFLIERLQENTLRYVQFASSVIFSIMLVLLLAQIDLTQNH